MIMEESKRELKEKSKERECHLTNITAMIYQIHSFSMFFLVSLKKTAKICCNNIISPNG